MLLIDCWYVSFYCLDIVLVTQDNGQTIDQIISGWQIGVTISGIYWNTSWNLWVRWWYFIYYTNYRSIFVYFFPFFGRSKLFINNSTLPKRWTFLLRTSSVNVTKSAVSWGICQNEKLCLMKNFIFL